MVRKLIAVGAAVGASAVGAGAGGLRRSRGGLGGAERRVEQVLGECERLRDALKQREAELVRRRELIERLHRGRRAERTWNTELRAQLQREHESHDGLEERADPRELILRAAIKL